MGSGLISFNRQRRTTANIHEGTIRQHHLDPAVLPGGENVAGVDTIVTFERRLTALALPLYDGLGYDIADRSRVPGFRVRAGRRGLAQHTRRRGGYGHVVSRTENIARIGAPGLDRDTSVHRGRDRGLLLRQLHQVATLSVLCRGEFILRRGHHQCGFAGGLRHHRAGQQLRPHLLPITDKPHRAVLGYAHASPRRQLQQRGSALRGGEQIPIEDDFRSGNGRSTQARVMGRSNQPQRPYSAGANRREEQQQASENNGQHIEKSRWPKHGFLLRRYSRSDRSLGARSFSLRCQKNHGRSRSNRMLDKPAASFLRAAPPDKCLALQHLAAQRPEAKGHSHHPAW